MFDEKEYQAKYREANREKLREYQRAWRKANRKEQSEYYKEYRKKNADKIYGRAKAKRADAEQGEIGRKKDRSYRQSSVRSFLSCKLGHIKKERHRGKHSEKYRNDIGLDYLLELWKKQDGRCAISGKELSCNFNDLFGVSIDRIDPNVGYMEGNVQLVCQAINFAKNKYSNDEMRWFWTEEKTRMGE